LQFCSPLQKTISKTLTPTLGTIFACTQPIFSIHCSSTAKLQKQKQKINQIIENQGFEAFAVFFAVALQWLCSFLTASENHDITKHHPAPPLDPPLARKLNNALHFF